jgi:hypothetical protein
MHRRTYERLTLRLGKIEADLSGRMKKKPADYANLVAHVP